MARQGVQLEENNGGGVNVQNGSASSLVSEVKEKQDQDSVLFQLKEAVHKQKVMVFSKGGYGVLRYQGRLCVPDFNGVQDKIMVEAHSMRYSIHLGSTKMYHDFREVYWWNGMNKDIVEFVSKCPSYQQVKVEHQNLVG